MASPLRIHTLNSGPRMLSGVKPFSRSVEKYYPTIDKELTRDIVWYMVQTGLYTDLHRGDVSYISDLIFL